MKIKPAGLSATIVIACILIGAAAFMKPRGRVLVLGFESSQLNDIQDRLFRETVMRRLHTEGFPVVPVMEIESVFNEDRKGRIRKLARGEIKGICEELAAGYALFGSIAPEDGKRDEGIMAGRNYVCRLVLYRGDKNRFDELKVTAAGRETLYEFYNALSALIVGEIGKLL